MWKGRELDKLCTLQHLEEIMHSIESAFDDKADSVAEVVMPDRAAMLARDQ